MSNRIKKVIIACSDEYVKNIMVEGFEKFLPKDRIFVCKTEFDMTQMLIESEDTAIIFDKFFLGFVLTYQILRLKVINEKILAYFVETGECSKYFGLRVYDLGIQGLIPYIEVKSKLKIELEKVIQGIKTFPEPVMRSIEENDYLLERKSFTEVTEKEMEIGLYLGMGKSQKEICYLTGMSAQAVCTHTCRLRRKIGYKDPSDYTRLSRQALKGLTRSAN